MPATYGRSIFATELRLRGGILSIVRDENWRSAESFEAPKLPNNSRSATQINDGDSSSVSPTSETSTACLFAKGWMLAFLI